MTRTKMTMTDCDKIPKYLRQRINIRGENECWEWQGWKTHRGYGRMRFKGRKKYIHHHLIVGSVQENIDDRNKRQRQAKGETHGRAKLSENDVQAIRSRRIPYKITLKELSKEFGVTLYQIHRIATGKSWRHIQ